MIFGKYLLREFIKLYFSICFGFLLIYCVIDFLEKNTRYFPKYNASGAVIVEYYLVQMPKMYVDISPFGVMLSSIITTLMFARSGEIAALRAAGQSIRAICRPLILMGLGLSLTLFAISEFIVPSALLQLQKIETVKIEKSSLSQMFLESQWVSGEDAILHFGKLNQLERSLMKPEYIVFRNQNEVEQIVHAERAVFDSKTGYWTLMDAIVSKFSPVGELLSTDSVKEFKTTISSQPPKLLREGISSDLVSFRELRQVIGESQALGTGMKNRETDLYQKLSSPLANLVFAFFAFPFALRRERQADTYIGIVICLLTAAIFWGSAAAMRALASSGTVPAFIAGWGPTLLFLILGAALMLRVDRRG
jgi:lipopolysaccharide export system permease protein